MPTPTAGANWPRSVEPVVGAVYGFRWWRVGPGGELRSPWHGPYRWGSGRNVARCFARPRIPRGWREDPSAHAAPDALCHCGFYGLWDVPSELVVGRIAMLWDFDAATSGGDHRFLLGVVEATGRILLGEDGFRAEHAKAVAIARGERVASSPDVEAVAPRFDLTMFGSVRALDQAWGPRIRDGRRLAGAA